MRFHSSILPSLHWVDLPGLASYWHKFSQACSRGLFKGLGIRQKIGYGYGIAISIAFVGISSGLLIEKICKGKAKQEFLQVHQQAYMVKYLQDAVLEVKTHQQQLFILAINPDKYANESDQLLENINDVNLKLEQLAKVISEYRVSNNHQTEKDVEINELMYKYGGIVQIYADNLWWVLKPIYDGSLSPEQIQEMQRLLIKFMSNDTAVKFNKFSEELSDLARNLQLQQEKAFVAYQRAENLGNLILLVSLFVSVTIAAAMASYTSSAIARPLEFTTAVAQRVTETGNFKLVAPVTTNDEVGKLANSLNQLIQRVATYTEEIKHTQAQLMQTEKMSSLGQMVAGVAHEINNPINFIYGNIYYLETYMKDLLTLVKLYQEQFPQVSREIEQQLDETDLEFIAEDAPKIFDSMKNGTERIRELVLSLRNFSRLDEADLKKVDLHEGIENTLLVLSNRLKGGIAVKRDYGNLPLVECYPALLNQVLLNIIANAIDALLSENEKANKEILIQTEGGNDEIVVRIQDNGCGIHPEIKHKIFDPFFTTKPVGQGTGLGLSVSYKIVEKHQGKILVNSQVERGTEFAIYLPVKQTISSAIFAA